MPTVAELLSESFFLQVAVPPTKASFKVKKGRGEERRERER